jgi:tetratricopeptide (TPR) repeat protein
VAALFWVWPLAHHAISLKPVPRPPLYARAVAKMQFGKYREAEQAIIGELEKCETDFDGWIMLASLYARQFHDLPEAERTIREICNEPGTTPSQVAIALNQMADWHLQVNADPVAARRALDEIVRRLPNTLLAWTAALRGQQLPATAAEWKEQQQARKFPLLPLSDQLDDRGAGTEPDPHDPAARALAERCIEKLKQDPNDVEVREQLALVLADQMGALGLAIDQINLLMEMPGQSAARFPGWLALMAGWEIRRGTNLDAARELLRRLIREHPDSVQAFAAQRRLKLLDMDEQIAKSGTAARGPVGAARPG